MVDKPEDLRLPFAVISRIISDSLPQGISVSIEARKAIAKSAIVFVLYTSSYANSIALGSKRKTINADDIFAALRDIQFGQFVEPLKACLESYRQEKNREPVEPNKDKEPSREEEITIDIDLVMSENIHGS